MQSHRDHDAERAAMEALRKYVSEDESNATTEEKEDLEKLKAVADEMVAKRESLITAGAPGEKEIFSKNVRSCGVDILLRQLPDDPLCLRISIGEGHRIPGSAYCVFRGDLIKAIALLKQARVAMQAELASIKKKPK